MNRQAVWPVAISQMTSPVLLVFPPFPKFYLDTDFARSRFCLLLSPHCRVSLAGWSPGAPSLMRDRAPPARRSELRAIYRRSTRTPLATCQCRRLARTIPQSSRHTAWTVASADCVGSLMADPSNAPLLAEGRKQKAGGSQARPSFLSSAYRPLLTARCFLLSAYSHRSATIGSTFIARRAGI